MHKLFLPGLGINYRPDRGFHTHERVHMHDDHIHEPGPIDPSVLDKVAGHHGYKGYDHLKDEVLKVGALPPDILDYVYKHPRNYIERDPKGYNDSIKDLGFNGLEHLYNTVKRMAALPPGLIASIRIKHDN